MYGTLRKGVANEFAAVLARSARYAGPAKARGRLYRVAHYPGFVASRRGCAWVHGDVYFIDHPVRLFGILDEYERVTGQSEYERVTSPVKLNSGKLIRTWVYVYRPSPVGLPRIVSGDFLAPGRVRAPGQSSQL